MKRTAYLIGALAAACAAAPALAQGFDADAATRAYLATLSGAARAKSDAYFEGGYWLILWGALVTILVNGALLHLGWAAKLSDWTKRTTGSRALQVVLFVAPYLVLTFLLTLPWTIYTDFVREHQYGLATQTFLPWFSERLIALVVSIISFVIIASAVFALIRRAGRAWWGWAATVTIAIMAFMIMLGPIFVEPLFNKYSSLPDGVVRQQTLSMARANSVPADNVYLVDASRQTTRISANVGGIGPTVRIALNDNLLKQGTPAEVRSVMGHELGHYVLNHIPKAVIEYGLLILFMFLAVAVFVPRLLTKNEARWRVGSIADPAAIPAAMIVIAVFFFLATPVTNSITRTSEQEADVFGLNAARAPDGFAKIALKLSTYRKIEPGPWEEMIFYDHPSGKTRILTAMRWKAEHLNEAGVE